MIIDACTKLTGLMGWPVQHSLSPQLHNGFFAAAGIDAVYVPLPVLPEGLHQAVAGAAAVGMMGFNVTIPHKIAIMDHLDCLDDMAAAVGAVNTVVNRNGCLVGYNTDASGFLQSLAAQGVNATEKRTVIFGAGGAARAVACGLDSQKPAAIDIFARQLAPADALAGRLKHCACGHVWQPSELNPCLKDADIIVNCTSLGMSPANDTAPDVDWQCIKKQAVICDVVYNPLETKFLQQAARHGHQVVGGLQMLIYQAALSFELWTGNTPNDIKDIQKIISKLLY